jgi:hypothetical protein
MKLYLLILSLVYLIIGLNNTAFAFQSDKYFANVGTIVLETKDTLSIDSISGKQKSLKKTTLKRRKYLLPIISIAVGSLGVYLFFYLRS